MFHSYVSWRFNYPVKRRKCVSCRESTSVEHQGSVILIVHIRIRIFSSLTLILKLRLIRHCPKILHLDRRSTDTAAVDIKRGSVGIRRSWHHRPRKKQPHTRPPSFSSIEYNSISHLLRRQGIERLPFSFVFPLSLGSVFIAGLPSLRSLVLGTCSALLQVLLLSRGLFSSQRGPPRSSLRQSCSALPSSSDLI